MDYEDNEMAKVREIFERALNAIVSATQLSKEVEQLRTEFNTLKHDVDSYRARNTELENELALVRDARDQALKDKQAAIEELNNTRTELERTQSDARSWLGRHEDLSQHYENLKHDHDNVQLELMQRDEEVRELKAKLEKVKAVFGIQPRDPASGQWESPREVLADEPTQEPRTGTEPYWR